MRGVLVHQHQRAVGGDGDDVGIQHLRHRRAERMRRVRLDRGRHARGGAAVEPQRRLGEAPLAIGGQPTGGPVRGGGQHAGQRQRADAGGRQARTAGARLEQMQRRAGRQGRALRHRAGAAGQRLAECRNHQAAHRGGVAEAQLRLAGVDVHVQLLRRAVRDTAPRPGGGRIRSRRDRRRAPRSAAPGRTTGRPFTVSACAAAVARVTAGEQAKPSRRRGPRSPDTGSMRRGGVGAEQGGDAGGAVLRRQVEQARPSISRRKATCGRGQREAADGRLGVVGLGARDA